MSNTEHIDLPPQAKLPNEVVKFTLVIGSSTANKHKTYIVTIPR